MDNKTSNMARLGAEHQPIFASTTWNRRFRTDSKLGSLRNAFVRHLRGRQKCGCDDVDLQKPLLNPLPFSCF